MTALTHEPSPLYASAWDADHPYVIENGRREGRFCLDTPAGEFCPACTDHAREEYDLPTDQYIAAEDCPAKTVTG